MKQLPNGIRFDSEVDRVDFQALREVLIADKFDNGRSAAEYEQSARNSFRNVYVYADEQIIGNARVLSDQVCNAYIIDVWVHSKYRRHGIATQMMHILLQELEGQHVYLFTDDRMDFYESLGFCPQPVGMSMVIGNWLRRSA